MKDKIIKSKAVITADMLSSIETTIDRLLSKTVCEEQIEQMANTLKPCPFCGSEAKLIKRKLKIGFYPSGGTYYVHCKNCLITTQPRNKKEPVIEIWNRRIRA